MLLLIITNTMLISHLKKALEWIVDVHNGILIMLGKEPQDNATEIWKLLKYTRSKRNALNEYENSENLTLKTIVSEKHFRTYTNSDRLTVVMFDKPHFLLLIPRADKKAKMDMAQMKARFDVECVIVPGSLSYRWYFANPLSREWKFSIE